MFQFDSAFQGEVRYTLSEATYKRLKDAETSDIKITVSDSQIIVNKTEKEVVSRHIRKVFFEPASIFDLTVSIDVVWTPTGEVDVTEVPESVFFSTMVNEKAQFLRVLYGRISLLIAQITSSTGGQPLITADTYTGKTE